MSVMTYCSSVNHMQIAVNCCLHKALAATVQCFDRVGHRAVVLVREAVDFRRLVALADDLHLDDTCAVLLGHLMRRRCWSRLSFLNHVRALAWNVRSAWSSISLILASTAGVTSSSMAFFLSPNWLRPHSLRPLRCACGRCRPCRAEQRTPLRVQWTCHRRGP